MEGQALVFKRQTGSWLGLPRFTGCGGGRGNQRTSFYAFKHGDVPHSVCVAVHFELLVDKDGALEVGQHHHPFKIQREEIPTGALCHEPDAWLKTPEIVDATLPAACAEGGLHPKLD